MILHLLCTAQIGFARAVEAVVQSWRQYSTGIEAATPV